MTLFLKSGKSYRVTTEEALDIHELLPPGNYTICQDQFGNFYLDKVDSFTIPSRLYGNTTRHTDRIINSYLDRNGSTGVLLNGEKGSGKTLLAKNISATLAERGIPTILINRAWTDEGFFTLLQEIDQPCAILLDEFEKVFDREQQEKILTLLDGVFGSKKLYILTCNDKWRIDSHMRNRPGRIYYLLDFHGLDQNFIEEYCQENLNNKSMISKVVTVSSMFTEFNFDMLKAMVEEMNRYDESPQEVLELLNVKAEFSGNVQYDIELSINGKVLPADLLYDSCYSGNPLGSTGVEVSWYPSKTARDSDEDCPEIDTLFRASSLVKVDAKNGLFVFEDDGKVLTLKRKERERYYINYDAI